MLCVQSDFFGQTPNKALPRDVSFVRSSKCRPLYPLRLFHAERSGRERRAVLQRIRRISEIDGDGRAVRERRALDRAVGRERAMVEHLRIARLAGDRTCRPVAADEFLFPFGPQAVVEDVHRRRAVEDVEEVAFRPQADRTVRIVVPVPV